MTEIRVQGDHITLGQLLKAAGVIETGGHARAFLAQNPADVNGESEARRGRKLFPGDQIRIGNLTIRLLP